MMTPEESKRERTRIISRIEKVRREMDQYLTDVASYNDNNIHGAKIDGDPDGTYSRLAADLDKWLAEAVLTDGPLPALPLDMDEPMPPRIVDRGTA